MATLIKKTGSRIGRWFKVFREITGRPTAGMRTTSDLADHVGK